MATLDPKVKADPKTTKAEPVNPAIDPALTAEERLAALTKQQEASRRNS